MKKILYLALINLAYQFPMQAQLNNNGAIIKLTTGSFIVLQDINLNNNGTFLQSTGSVKMTGATNNYILGLTRPQFFNLVIAKNETKQVQLATDINIAGELQFSSGLLHLNRKSIFLVGAALLKGEMENRRIIGPTGGYVEAKALLIAPANANPGNLGAWITSGRNLGTTIIRRGHQSQAMGGGVPAGISRHYEIIPAVNTNLNATLRLTYFDAELNGLTESNLVMYKKINSAAWTDQGYTQRTATGNYVLKNAITDLYRSTLSVPVAVLRGFITNNESNNLPGNPGGSITKNQQSLFIESVYPTIGNMQSIFIRPGNMNIEHIQITVFDMKGKLLLTRQAGYTSQWIALPPLLAAGVYQLIIRSGDNTYQQRFVKQQ